MLTVNVKGQSEPKRRKRKVDIRGVQVEDAVDLAHDVSSES